jgi:hypothetical protein
MASNRNLIPGDLLAIAIITLIGFATHGEAGLPVLPRMAAVFFPLAVTWFILATALQLFQQEVVSDPRQLWRPALTMIFAASLAAILRGLILNAPVIPIFGLVLSATSAFGMLVWRVIYLILNRKAG